MPTAQRAQNRDITLGISQIQMFSHALYIKHTLNNTVILLTFLTVVPYIHTELIVAFCQVVFFVYLSIVL